MAFFEWNDKLSVQVPEMDQQHKKLIAIINELHEAMSKRRAAEVISGIITRLVDYTKTHFGDEERFLQRVNYPKLQAQKSSHVRFVERINQFKAEYEKNNAVSAPEVMLFLKNWLTGHIQHDDAEYGKFVTSNQKSGVR